MTLFLLRHGEIEISGPNKQFIGQTDVPISERGRHQARMWQEAFSELSFEAIYASDLSRCAETAGIIADGRALNVHFLPDLREIHLGKLEGLEMDDVRRRFFAEWTARGNDISRYTPEGGESFTDLQRRVIPVFEKIARTHDGDILIVSHAGVNRIILCHVLGMPLGNLFRIDQSYGGLNTLEHRQDGFQVAGINQMTLKKPLPYSTSCPKFMK